MLNNNCRETPAERMMIFFNRFVNTKTIDLFDNFGVEQVYEFKTVSRRSNIIDQYMLVSTYCNFFYFSKICTYSTVESALLTLFESALNR